MRMVCLLIFVSFASLLPASDTSPPQLILANLYHPDIDIQQYWVSEKFDGVRAYWNGTHLLSRQGNILHAPSWFLAQLPNTQTLDGELWLGRGKFETLSALVRKQQSEDQAWQSVIYQIFDLPGSQQIFDKRIEQMQGMFTPMQQPNIRVVKQVKVSTHTALFQMLEAITLQGAEGLMLHRGSARYQPGRSDDLLKLKLYQDAEAKVIRHIPGKGRLTGMLGALLVEDDNGRRFRIGTGFSDAERRSPPPPGSIVSYKYYGRTSSGIPRFASFLRRRQNP